MGAFVRLSVSWHYCVVFFLQKSCTRFVGQKFLHRQRMTAFDLNLIGTQIWYPASITLQGATVCKGLILLQDFRNNDWSSSILGFRCIKPILNLDFFAVHLRKRSVKHFFKWTAKFSREF